MVRRIAADGARCRARGAHPPALLPQPARHVLLATTAGVAGVAVALPYLPGVSVLGFVPLTAPILASVILIAGAYVAATELAKVRFFRGRRIVGRSENRFSTP